MRVRFYKYIQLQAAFTLSTSISFPGTVATYYLACRRQLNDFVTNKSRLCRRRKNGGEPARGERAEPRAWTASYCSATPTAADPPLGRVAPPPRLCSAASRPLTSSRHGPPQGKRSSRRHGLPKVNTCSSSTKGSPSAARQSSLASPTTTTTRSTTAMTTSMRRTMCHRYTRLRAVSPLGWVRRCTRRTIRSRRWRRRRRDRWSHHSNIILSSNPQRMCIKLR